jgi:hypothetical protein
MESRVKIAGHGVHPILIVVPPAPGHWPPPCGPHATVADR